MSDTPQGPDWWLATDGKYYPPEQRPGAAPTVPPPGAPDPGPPPGGPPSGSLPGPPPGFPLGGQPAGQTDAKSFVSSLYDFKFDHFVTPKLLRFFYAFFVVVLTIGAVIFLLASLASGEGGAIIAALFIVPIGYFAYMILIRMYFELVAALFRITDDLRAIRRGHGY